MPKGQVFANDVLALAYNSTVLSWNANTNLYLSLHSADPTPGGNQTSSEVVYTGYSRATQARTSGGFTVSEVTGTGASCTISGYVLTVGGAVTGTWQVGQVVTGASVPANTIIESLGTGTGGGGTYNLSTISTIGSGEAMTGYCAQIVLASTVSFPACTGGTATAAYFAVGTASSGTGEILHTGPLSPTINISTGVTPQLTTGTTITEA